MTIASTQDEFELPLGGDTKLVTGTFTISGGSTSGTVVIQGVTDVLFFSATPTVNATAVYYTATANSVAMTTGTNEVGTWLCIGRSA